MQTQQAIKVTGDATAYGTAVATLVGWLPNIAALLSILWFAIQITEKVTGRTLHDMLRCRWDCVCMGVRDAWKKLRS